MADKRKPKSKDAGAGDTKMLEKYKMAVEETERKQVGNLRRALRGNVVEDNLKMERKKEKELAQAEK